MIRVAAVQSHPRRAAPRENLRRIEELVRGTAADLFVCPELCTTGYAFASREEARSWAEPYPQGPALRALADLSGEVRAVLVAGFAEITPDGTLYNSAALFDRGRPLACYRKIHLFDTEFGWAAPGDRPPRVVCTSAGRLGPMICFDWIFPEMARCLALGGAQILVHCANLVLPYCQDAMPTRCIENRVFAVTANRVGSERSAAGELTFTGASQITGHRGDRLAKATVDEEGVIVADIDPALADDKQITPANHATRDRRPGLYRAGWG